MTLEPIIDFLFPRFCSVCGHRLQIGEKSICMNCLLDLQLTQYADGRKGNQLERVFWYKTPIERAAAFMVYDRESEQHNLVIDLKYHNQPEIGYHVGRIMCNNLIQNHFFDGIDVIIPIPIPRKRRLTRGYNQSEYLAKGISKETNIPIDCKSVRRKKYATSQTFLSASERQQNVVDSFYLKNAEKLKGKHILIIDDVITTTSTTTECAQLLATIEGVRLSVLSLAVSKNLIRNLRNSNPVDIQKQATK